MFATVDEYIAANGVTRCPTAACARTRAEIPLSDQLALDEYYREREKKRKSKISGYFIWGAVAGSVMQSVIFRREIKQDADRNRRS